MQVNQSNFAQTYQTIRHAQVVSDKPANITPEQKNNVSDVLATKESQFQQTQDNIAQQKRTTATNAIDYRQTQDNLDTYIQSYQNSTGNENDASANSLSYSDIKSINQSITRNQVANSDLLSSYVDRQQALQKPELYYQNGLHSQIQTGSTINTFA